MRLSPLCVAFTVVLNERLLAVEGQENESATRMYGVVGILSVDTNHLLRQAQRDAWIDALRERPSPARGVEVFFLLDRRASPTSPTSREDARHRDLIFLNASYTGRANHFGEKLILWLRLARSRFPGAAWYGKMDDDVYVCPRAWDAAVWPRVSPLMYLGWFHKGGSRRADELFVVLGAELVARLAPRPYCARSGTLDQEQVRKRVQKLGQDVSLKQAKQWIKAAAGGCAADASGPALIDTGYAGSALGAWVREYADVREEDLAAAGLSHTMPDHAGDAPPSRRRDGACDEKHVLFHGIKFPQRMKCIGAQQRNASAETRDCMTVGPKMVKRKVHKRRSKPLTLHKTQPLLHSP